MTTASVPSLDDSLFRLTKNAMLVESMVMVGSALTLRTPSTILGAAVSVVGWLGLCLAQACMHGRGAVAADRGKRFARCVFSPSTYKL